MLMSEAPALIVKHAEDSPGSQMKAQSSDLKVLKAEDVEDADGFEVFLPFDFLIDFEDDPRKALGV